MVASVNCSQPESETHIVTQSIVDEMRKTRKFAIPEMPADHKSRVTRHRFSVVPLLACEFALRARTVRQAFSKRTPVTTIVKANVKGK